MWETTAEELTAVWRAMVLRWRVDAGIGGRCIGPMTTGENRDWGEDQDYKETGDGLQEVSTWLGQFEPPVPGGKRATVAVVSNG